MAQQLSAEDIQNVLKISTQSMYALLRFHMGTVRAAITLWNSASTDMRARKPINDVTHIIADQADAVVDLRYYCLNALAKVGINTDGKQRPTYQSNTQSARVTEFTVLSSGITPSARSMNEAESVFLVRMMCSELVELVQTCKADADALKLLQDAILSVDEDAFITEYSAAIDACPSSQRENIEIRFQINEIEDLWNAIYDIYRKRGINLDKVFDVVHEANMAKRFPDGTFHKREDGKIIKPPEWKEPDIVAVIAQQMSHHK